MTNFHLDRELLHGVYRGDLPERLLSRLGLMHLLEVCPHCRREMLAFHQEVARSTGSLIGIFPDVLKQHLAELRRDHRAAARDLEALLKLPQEERFAKVSRARRRFRGLHLVQLILERCEECFTADPAQARHLAELARAVIYASPVRSGVMDWMATAATFLANACRAGGDLRQADEHFEHVHYLLRQFPVPDAGMLARIADLEASLRKDQRRFVEAEALLRRALSLYLRGGGRHDVARVLINAGDLLFTQGKLSEAIAATEEALGHLEPDSRLYLMGRYNLTLQLAEAGQPERAAVLLAEDRELYRRSPDSWTQLRLLCVQAKIAAGLGEPERALALFAEARDGFLRQGIGYDAAIVSLEIAVLYLRTGRHALLPELAEAVAAIFQAQDVHREALAALLLFQEAARAGAVTDALLSELRAYFRVARPDPDYPFRPSAG